MLVWNAILLMATLGILAPIITWSVECAAALLPRKKLATIRVRRPKIAVLIPAHNEASGIHRTLESVMPQMLEGDRVVVIADHCTDATAEIARELGCVVFERGHPTQQGKSYALADAVQWLHRDTPEIFIVIDADCIAHPGAIDALARLAHASRAPVQAKYTLEPPPGANPERQIAALAFRIKNFVRPLGLQRLGLDCVLNGSGMAFPGDLLQRGVLTSNKLAEDIWLTIDLALLGHVAQFCPEAEITSTLPDGRQAAVVQSTRWTHGHLECMFRAPVLLLAALRQRRWRLLGLFFDLLVPPLSLLIILWVAIAIAGVTSGLVTGFWLSAILALSGGAMIALSFFGVGWKFGPPGMVRFLLGLPFYVASRTPIFIRFLFLREKKWVRTARRPFPGPQ